MKKPINKFAVALWVLAAIALLSDASSYPSIRDMLNELVAHGDPFYVVESALWTAFRAPILSAAVLASLGVLIELVDQIRWNALQRRN